MAENQTKQSNKKVVIGIVAMVAVVALLAVCFFVFREKPVAGAKKITIEVVDNTQASTTYTVHTDAEYLRQAMEEADGLTFSGEEGAYGFTVMTVNGVTADFNNGGAYWSFYVNDEYCNYGVSEQPVDDGDAFVIKYEVYTE